MDILYEDARIVVAVKPAGVLSTDEPGGMPELLRRALGEPETGCVRTVHRLDRPVGGVMVYAKTVQEAARLTQASSALQTVTPSRPVSDAKRKKESSICERSRK